MKRLWRILLLILLLIVTAANWPWARQSAYKTIRAATRALPVWSNSQWNQLQSEHFWVYYQDADSEIVDGVVADLEDSLQGLQAGLATAVPARIPVFIQPAMSALTAALGGAYGPTLGAYQLGRLQLLSPLAWQPELDPASAVAYYRQNGPVAHELTHLLLDYQVSGNTPVWFSEGLAQYWELQLKGYVWEEPGVDWMAEAVPLAELSSRFAALPENTAYRESLAVVEYFYATYGADAVRAVIGQLGAGRDFASAVRTGLGSSLEQVDREWRTAVAE